MLCYIIDQALRDDKEEHRDAVAESHAEQGLLRVPVASLYRRYVHYVDRCIRIYESIIIVKTYIIIYIYIYIIL